MGTYDKFARPEQSACNPPTLMVADNEGACLAPNGIGQVGQERVSHNAGPRITDTQRESAIARAGQAIEKHMADLRAINNRNPHIFSDFADAAAARWKAGRARELMEQLIAGRSPEQIARMEEQRGLR